MKTKQKTHESKGIVKAADGWVVKDLHGGIHDTFRTRSEARTRLRAHKKAQVEQARQTELMADTDIEGVAI